MIGRSCILGPLLIILGVNSGCSHLRSKPQTPEKGVAALGTDLPNRDIYARRDETPSRTPTPASPASIASADPPASDEPPTPANPVDESIAAHQPTVRLQPPVGVDPARSASAPTSRGVPDSARLIAGSNRREAPVRPAAAPEVAATTLVVREARSALDSMATYQLDLKRQERVNGLLLPPESLVMSIRRQPKAARLTWVEGTHRGREVLYRADEPGGQMHVNMADSKLPMPRLALAPDSPMVMKNSRHPITEAGLDPIIASLEQADRAGQLVDLGMQTPAQLDHPMRGLQRQTAEGDVWRAYFDPADHLPALVECFAANGDLLEQYRFQAIRPDPAELASADAFDPNARWGPPRGLFGKMSAKAGDPGSAAAMR